MPQASVVAAELRRLADSLDKEPEAEIERPTLDFYHWSKESKDRFLNLARLFPRPFDKCYEGNDFKILYENDGIKVYAKADRDYVCKLVTPAVDAVYECEPLLSQEELDEVGR